MASWVVLVYSQLQVRPKLSIFSANRRFLRHYFFSDIALRLLGPAPLYVTISDTRCTTPAEAANHVRRY